MLLMAGCPSNCVLELLELAATARIREFSVARRTELDPSFDTWRSLNDGEPESGPPMASLHWVQAASLQRRRSSGCFYDFDESGWCGTEERGAFQTTLQTLDAKHGRRCRGFRGVCSAGGGR